MPDLIQVGESDIVRVTDDGADIVSVGSQGPQGIQGPEGDPGQGVPVGGTALQLLTKVDAVDYNTQWSSLVASQIPVLDAAQISTGIFDVARIPTLTLAKISDAGTMAAQNANNVAITGGTINGATIGASSRAPGNFSTFTTNSTISAVFYSPNLGARLEIIAPDFANNEALIRTYTYNGFQFQVDGVAKMATHVRGLWVNGYDITNGGLAVVSVDANNYPTLKIKGTTNQISDLQRWVDANNNILSFVAASGAATFGRLDAGTNDTQTALTIRRNSSGTPTANFASRLLWQLETSTTENVDAASIIVSHVIATHASRTQRVVFNVNDANGAREYLRGEASGSAPMIGFLGAAAVIRQALGAWAGLTDAQKLDALRDALTNLGLTSYT